MQHVIEHGHFGLGFLAARHAVAESVGRVLGRGYLHAAMAVCALTASAEGSVGFEERYAVDAAMVRDPLLKRFSEGPIVTVLDDQLERLRRDPEGARDDLLHLVERAGRRPEHAVSLARLGWDIITADGSVHRAELAEFETICDLLEVDVEGVRGAMLGV
jgi:tellurite resistance protein TerB